MVKKVTKVTQKKTKKAPLFEPIVREELEVDPFAPLPKIAPPDVIAPVTIEAPTEERVLVTPRKSRAKARKNKDGSVKVLSTMRAELEKHLLSGVVERPVKYMDTPLEAVKDKLFLCVPLSNWPRLARLLSEALPGQIWVGSSGITHVHGGKVCWVTSPSSLQGVQEARGLAYRLLSEERWQKDYTEKEKAKYKLDALPYSIAGIARLLLGWTKCQQRTRELDCINADSHWQFQLCKPGFLERGYLWDITACYYSLLCRAPGPYVVLREGELAFCEESEPGEFSRWFAMLGAVGLHKGLRNSLVGQMFSSGDGEYYYDGIGNKDKDKLVVERAEKEIQQEGMSGAALDLEERVAEKINKDIDLKEHVTGKRIVRKKKPAPGLLRPLASLVVRTAYELACLAAKEEKAYYSNTDCVITANPYCPNLWARYGLEVALKGAGKTEICSVGNYRVGEQKSVPYRKHKKGLPRPRVPALPDRDAVRLILSGEIWIDRWLVPSETWTPDIRVLARAEEREETAKGLREVARIAAQQEAERPALLAKLEEERAIEKERQEREQEEYNRQVDEAF